LVTGAAAGFACTGATEHDPFEQEDPLLPKMLSTDSAPKAMPTATMIETIVNLLFRKSGPVAGLDRIQTALS